MRELSALRFGEAELKAVASPDGTCLWVLALDASSSAEKEAPSKLRSRQADVLAAA